jgi:hypothetical protein
VSFTKAIERPKLRTDMKQTWAGFVGSLSLLNSKRKVGTLIGVRLQRGLDVLLNLNYNCNPWSSGSVGP